eukprot:Nitzschia sp. Nitz4//scaffold68_size99682//46050//47252//NITZ4_004565-RA/size99682-processed-gene-0.92-mRNA-1//-1//CDS//3329556596//8537//frame0
MTSLLENQVHHHHDDDDDNVKPREELFENCSSIDTACLEAYRWRNHASQFPWKLHIMLEDAEKNHFSNIVAWLPDQRTFRVHDIRLFVEQVLPQYFRQTQYKSFQRQLNLWGFERNNQTGVNFGGYGHEHFVRGQASLCQKMKRLKIKGNGPKKTLSPNTSQSKKQECRAVSPPIVSPALPNLAHQEGMVRNVAVVTPESNDGYNSILLPPPLPSRRTTPFQKQLPSSSEIFIDLFDDATLASVLLPEQQHFVGGNGDKLPLLRKNDKVATLPGYSLPPKSSMTFRPVILPSNVGVISFPPPLTHQSSSSNEVLPRGGLRNLEELFPTNLDEVCSPPGVVLQPRRYEDVLSVSPFPFFS